MSGSLPVCVEDLLARFATDDRLQLAHDVRIRMRADRRAEAVVRTVRIGHPVAQRFIDRGAQRLIAARHGHDRRAEQLHASDVRRLALHVDRSHIHSARHAEPRARGGGRDAVLAGAGFGDDALRAELLREQHLADGVVDLVRAGVREVFALQPDLRAPALRQRARVRQRRRPADPAAQLGVKLGEEVAVAQIAIDARLQTIERRHERLGHVAAAERPEAAARVGILALQDVGERRLRFDRNRRCFIACSVRSRAGATHEFMNPRRILDARRRLDAAAHVDAERPNRAIASATLVAFSPPASTSCVRARELRGAVPVGGARRRRSPGLRTACAPASWLRRQRRTSPRDHRHHCKPVGTRSVARSSTSVCSTSGRNTDHTSSSCALRRMQHHRDSRNLARHALRELAPPAAP